MDREGDVYKELPCANWCPPHTPLYTRDDTALLRQALDALESDPNAMVEVEPAQWEYKRTIVATALRERLGEKA